MNKRELPPTEEVRQWVKAKMGHLSEEYQELAVRQIMERIANNAIDEAFGLNVAYSKIREGKRIKR